MSDGSDDAQVRQLTAQLEKLGLNDPAKVLNCSERILSLAPNYTLALHCKGVAQLQMNKYDHAVVSLQKAVDASTKEGHVGADLRFHLSCGLYRQGKHVEALANLEKIPAAERNLGVRHLLAQCYYNTEKFKQCAAIYEEMLTNDDFRDDQDKLEVITNLTAAYAACDPAKVDELVQDADEKTSDLFYNAATAKLELRDLDAALKLLDTAEEFARRENELDPKAETTDADLENKALLNEVAAIHVQRSYIYYVQGKYVEAEKILHRILARKPSSISTYAVACVNWAALKKHSDFYDTYRQLKHAQQPSVQVKLTSKQRLYVQYNTALLLLHTGGKLTQCRNIIDKILSENPDSPLGPLAMVALLLKDKSAAKAEAYLKGFLQKQKDAGKTDQSNAQLLVAQLWLEQGNLDLALRHLAEIKSFVATKPAAVATLAEGYAKLGDLNAAKAVLKDAITSKVEGVDEYAAKFFLSNGLFDEAVGAYKALLKGDRKNDPVLLSGLAVSLTTSSPDEAFTIATGQLLPAEEKAAAQSTSRDVLERQQLPRAVLEEKGYKRKVEGLAEEKQGKKKRVRKMRHPPAGGVDGKADPERWIPMMARVSVQDLPPRRIKEMKRQRAAEQERKRNAHKKKQAEAQSPKASS